MALPAEGMPALSAIPSTARQPASVASPRVKPVAIPAQDHKPTAMVTARFSPMRSMSMPANGVANVSIDGPIPSYRLQLIREGLQDWALFALATQRGLGAYAKSQVALAYGQLGACTWSGCTRRYTA